MFLKSLIDEPPNLIAKFKTNFEFLTKSKSTESFHVGCINPIIFF